MNKETVKKLLSSSSGEDQRLGLEYLQYLKDQEIEEIVPLFNVDVYEGFKNISNIDGYIELENSVLLLGTLTIIRYSLENLIHFKEGSDYTKLNKNLTLWQENQLIQQNQDK